jgi:hypothetical protein
MTASVNDTFVAFVEDIELFNSCENQIAPYCEAAYKLEVSVKPTEP